MSWIISRVREFATGAKLETITLSNGEVQYAVNIIAPKKYKHYRVAFNDIDKNEFYIWSKQDSSEYYNSIDHCITSDYDIAMSALKITRIIIHYNLMDWRCMDVVDREMSLKNTTHL